MQGKSQKKNAACCLSKEVINFLFDMICLAIHWPQKVLIGSRVCRDAPVSVRSIASCHQKKRNLFLPSQQ